MASYNYGRFIGEAAASALQQPPCSEIVVQDARSTDETLQALGELRDSRLKVKSEPDLGQCDALNRAFVRANGDVIAWLNADEFYLPGAFQLVSDVLTALPDVDVVYGDTLFIDEQGQVIRLVGRIPPSSLALRWYDCYIGTCTTFFRKHTHPQFWLDPTLRRVMDWDLYLRWMHSDVQFAYVPLPFGAYRIHRGQITYHDRSHFWARRVESRLHREQVSIRRRYGQPGRHWALIPFLGLGDLYYRTLKHVARSPNRERALSDFAGKRIYWTRTGPSAELQAVWSHANAAWRADGAPVWLSPRRRLSLPGVLAGC